MLPRDVASLEEAREVRDSHACKVEKGDVRQRFGDAFHRKIPGSSFVYHLQYHQHIVNVPTMMFLCRYAL